MPSIDALDLTDSQTSAIARACEAIAPVDRDPFLRALTHRLRGEVIGDGSVGRAIGDLLGMGCYRLQMTVAVGDSFKGATVRKRPQLWRKTRSA
jgi:hypothetical protein